VLYIFYITDRQTDSGTVVKCVSFIAVLRTEAVGRWFNRLRLSVQDYCVWCDGTRSTLDIDCMTICSLAGGLNNVTLS